MLPPSSLFLTTKPPASCTVALPELSFLQVRGYLGAQVATVILLRSSSTKPRNTPSHVFFLNCGIDVDLIHRLALNLDFSTGEVSSSSDAVLHFSSREIDCATASISCLLSTGATVTCRSLV